MDLRLPATEAPAAPRRSPSRSGWATPTRSWASTRGSRPWALFREALDRLGAVPNAALADRRPGPVRIGGLVVTRQHPMTARGTVFLALEDETGMVNVTLWPDTWQRLRSTIRRHALLLVDGDLQREGEVVNVIARDVRPLVEAANERRRPGLAGGRPPDGPGRDAAAGLGAIAVGQWLRRSRLMSPRPCCTGLARLGPALVPVRVREIEEPAVPGGGRGEQRGADRRDEEAPSAPRPARRRRGGHARSSRSSVGAM